MHRTGLTHGSRFRTVTSKNDPSFVLAIRAFGVAIRIDIAGKS